MVTYRTTKKLTYVGLGLGVYVTVSNSEHRKMRAKQQHVCKKMNQYTNNTNRKWFLSFSIEWTIGANDRK
jgi:hypothetical protein